MKTAAAAPYLLPPERAVAVQAWMNEDGVEITERLDHWDPHTDLNLVRIAEIDIDLIRESCLLGEDSAFALTATWSSTTTRIAGHGPVVELGVTGGLVRTAINVEVAGSKVGGRLDLSTRLVLRYPGREPSQISPRRVGAALWAEQDRIALEGGAARFPIALADFSSALYPDGAAWVLEWDSDDLDAPVLGGMRLLLNKNHEALLQTLKTGSADARAAAVRSFVIFDAARSLITGALSNERFVENPEAYSEGSVGRMLFELLALCWAGVPAAVLRARSVDEPSRFSAELQAHFGLMA